MQSQYFRLVSPGLCSSVDPATRNSTCLCLSRPRGTVKNWIVTGEGRTRETVSFDPYENNGAVHSSGLGESMARITCHSLIHPSIITLAPDFQAYPSDLPSGPTRHFHNSFSHIFFCPWFVKTLVAASSSPTPRPPLPAILPRTAGLQRSRAPRSSPPHFC